MAAVEIERLPRYRQMIEDSLDGPGRIVLATVPAEHASELAGSPPVRPWAGLGEIARHDRLDDGRFLIWLFGLARVRIVEVASDRLYRQVAYEPLEEIPPDQAQSAQLREPLMNAILQRRKEPLTFADEVPTGFLVGMLLQHIDLPEAELERIFDENSTAERARLVLEAHARYGTK